VIVAAGLTPAWQQIMRFARLEQGQVNRAAEVHWCASGKNINVGAALAALGEAAVTVSPLGGWSGRAIAQEFASRNLAARWSTSRAATRVCTTLLDEEGSATELVENAAPLTEEERTECCAAYHEAAASAEFIVLTGSLPHGTPATFYRDLLRRTPCPAVLDVRGPELLAALECRPRLVKPNREELAMTLGRPLSDTPSLIAAMRELIDRGAQAVVVTQGKNAAWVAEGTRLWQVPPPLVETVVNPIGCGDCVAAGLAAGLCRGLPLIDAVRLGLAAAADNVAQLLPARLKLDRVHAWYERTAALEMSAVGAEIMPLAR
jgi:tagatose 6-phosphate kinase